MTQGSSAMLGIPELHPTKVLAHAKYSVVLRAPSTIVVLVVLVAFEVQQAVFRKGFPLCAWMVTNSHKPEAL